MSTHVNSLFEQARKLTARERADLVELLLGSLEPDNGAAAANLTAWAAEAHRRWDEHVASGGETSPGLRAEMVL